ncbi:hypothetical protein TNCV_3126731 [Trichonephila clavipes]|nr:hypothetical protein TNCV_3126731 [Trichonephila clavipes]
MLANRRGEKHFRLFEKVIIIYSEEKRDHCNNEMESEEEVNKIEFSSNETEDLRYIAPRKKKSIISDFETESDLDGIDVSSDKEISAEKVADGTL